MVVKSSVAYSVYIPQHIHKNNKQLQHILLVWSEAA